MQSKGTLRLWARLALLFVAIIWGSTLVVSKSTTGTIHPNLLIALRFIIAFVVLSVVYFRRMRKFNWSYVWRGLIIGFCLFLAHSAQTIGVTDAEGMPGRSGFLSAAYCVMVPFIFWAVDRVRPNRYNLLAAVLCVLGIGFVSFGGVSLEELQQNAVMGFTLADALALLSGFFFAAHIVAIEKYSRDKDSVLITISQFLAAGLFSTITTLIVEPNFLSTTQWSVDLWGAVLYLAIICTALALLLQNLAQKHTDPNSAAIILGSESIFCILFGVLFAEETLTSWLWIGFILIFFAILVSETKLSFLHKHKTKDTLKE